MNELLRFEKGCWARSTRLSQRRWTAGQACWANRSERVCGGVARDATVDFFLFYASKLKANSHSVSGVAENKE